MGSEVPEITEHPTFVDAVTFDHRRSLFWSAPNETSLTMPRCSKPTLATIAAVLSLAAAIPVHPGADRHRRLQDSIQECRDGHDGVLVELLPSALP